VDRPVDLEVGAAGASNDAVDGPADDEVEALVGA
jgi:hypothetical protein